MIALSITFFLVGGLCGVLTMAIFASNAYEKGYRDGKSHG
jgi:hypothetical protein